MHILEYSPTEGYHISTLQQCVTTRLLWALADIEKDYSIIGHYPTYQAAKARQDELMKCRCATDAARNACRDSYGFDGCSRIDKETNTTIAK